VRQRLFREQGQLSRDGKLPLLIAGAPAAAARRCRNGKRQHRFAMLPHSTQLVTKAWLRTNDLRSIMRRC